MPIEKVDLESNTSKISSKSNKDPKKPSLERSISGRRAHTTIKCDFLVPIQLDAILPDSYPSETKPLFKITAEWLNRSQLSQLSLKLNEIWEENAGMHILFTWFEWIKTNLVEYLELFEEPNKIILTPLNNDDECGYENSCCGVGGINIAPFSSNFGSGSQFRTVDDLFFKFLR